MYEPSSLKRSFHFLCLLKAGKTRLSILWQTTTLTKQLLTDHMQSTSARAHSEQKPWQWHQWQTVQLLTNDKDMADLQWETNLSRVNLSVNSGFFHCCHLKLLLLTHTLRNGRRKRALPAVCEEEAAEQINMSLFAFFTELCKAALMS